MPRTVVIKGHVVGPRTVELDEPIPGDARDVEVTARVADEAGAADRPNPRTRELAWLRDHGEELQPFEGEWVVLEGEQIVAHGPDPAAIVAEARTKGVIIPYVFFVDSNRPDTVKLGL